MLKWDEVHAFKQTPHPIWFAMGFDDVTVPDGISVPRWAVMSEIITVGLNLAK